MRPLTSLPVEVFERRVISPLPAPLDVQVVEADPQRSAVARQKTYRSKGHTAQKMSSRDCRRILADSMKRINHHTYKHLNIKHRKYIQCCFQSSVYVYVYVYVYVNTRMSDVEYRKTKGISKDMSLKDAWNIMNHKQISSLPAVTESGMLEGLITMSDITKSYKIGRASCRERVSSPV